MASETRILGLRTLLDELAKLPADLAKSSIYSSLGAAGRVVRDAAIAKAPVIDADDPAVKAGRRKPGTIKERIRVSRSKINKGQRGLYEVIVRVKPLKNSEAKKLGKRSAKNPNDPYYWYFVEFGTSKMAKRPFMRPAFDQTKDMQLAKIKRGMQLGLGRAAKKIAAKVNNGA